MTLPPAIAAVLSELAFVDDPARVEVSSLPAGGFVLWWAVESDPLEVLQANARMRTPTVVNPDSGRLAVRLEVSPLEWMRPEERLHARLAPTSAAEATRRVLLAMGMPATGPAERPIGRTRRLRVLGDRYPPLLMARLFAGRLLRVEGRCRPPRPVAEHIARVLLGRSGGCRDHFHLLRGTGDTEDVDIFGIERALPLYPGGAGTVRGQAGRLLTEVEEDRRLVELFLDDQVPASLRDWHDQENQEEVEE